MNYSRLLKIASQIVFEDVTSELKKKFKSLAKKHKFKTEKIIEDKLKGDVRFISFKFDPKLPIDERYRDKFWITLKFYENDNRWQIEVFPKYVRYKEWKSNKATIKQILDALESFLRRLKQYFMKVK